MTRRITPQSSLENLRKEAKRWLKSVRAGDTEARARLVAANPKVSMNPVLRDVQHALAQEYGFPGWNQLRAALPRDPSANKPSAGDYEQLAHDLVIVYAADDAGAMQRINRHFSASYAPDDVRALVWRLLYKVRQAKGKPSAFQLPEAQEMVARTAGFPNWQSLIGAAAVNATPPGPAYAVDRVQNRLSLRRIPSAEDWDTIIGTLKERRIPALAARMMTDEALRRIAELDFVTSLSLGGSRGLSDEGLQVLARMPQLEQLELNEYPGGNLTDRGLEVLRHLPNLRKFEMCWQKGVTDAGVANLRYCEHLEQVNLMGTPTGDGAIAALRGKSELHHFSTGRQVTDAGLAMLREIPCFQQWPGGECRYDLMTMGEEPTWLLIDGPFADSGLDHVAKLDGISGLNIFWHAPNVTAAGVGALVAMRNLRHFRCFDELANDAVLAHIGRMPRLQMLIIQGTVASDEGFAALSQSRSLEYIWGRECPNLTGRGFAALSRMPSLRGLGVSCKQVDDVALDRLPDFPSLVEFMPMDVADEGFRAVGKCERLQKLWCMYCRETGDLATERVAGLRLKSYYAGLTQITDRSLEILGRMDSLELVELFETKAVTDVGLAHLAKLPRLRRIELSGLPGVTLFGTQQFPASVQVNWDV